MNNKKATNSQVSTIESKTKQISRTGTESYILRSFGGLSAGTRKGRMGEKVQGLRSTNWQGQKRHGDVKNSIGNGEAKDLLCLTHGHELGEETAGGMGIPDKGGQSGKNWETEIA